MLSNLSPRVKKLIEAIARKEKQRPDDWLLMHLDAEYLKRYKRPFHG